MAKATTPPTATGAPPGSVDDVVAMLRARGGRATPPRRTLLEVLFESDRHLSAEELAAEVHERSPDVHLSTVYRNLEELQNLGVVAHTHLGHGPVTYQLAAHAHAHLVCDLCGKRVEAGDELFRDLIRKARRELGFTIDPHHVGISGRCSDCVDR
jgi:Fe2+ or Zn2+ uptake regulation protein